MSHAATLSAAAAAAAAAAEDKKPIMAAKFKTTMCKKFKQTGECPYEGRCMFAHGAAELRTKEQNLADGLTSEEAVKEYQRTKFIAARVSAKKAEKKAKKALKKKAAAAVEREDDEQSESGSLPAKGEVSEWLEVQSNSDRTPTPVTLRAVPAADTTASSAMPSMLEMSAVSTSTAAATPVRRYRHDPYNAEAVGLAPRLSPLALAMRA